MSEPTKITIWSVVTEKGLKHNHISEGWNSALTPRPLSDKFTNQKSWEKMNWHKDFGWLLDGKVYK